MKVVFLDRDGVISEDRPDYVTSWKAFEFIPGSLEAIKDLSENGFVPVVITNQSAVGRGRLTRDGLTKIHSKMTDAITSYGGRIEAIYAEVGDRITKGTALVQMDRTQLHQAEIQLKTVETDFKRLDTLAKVGSIAQQQYDQLKAQYEVAKSNVDFLRENTRLLAPFSGVISGRYFEAGELYSGAPNTQAGKAAVLSLVQIDRLKAMVALSEKYFPLVRNGMEVAVLTDIYKDKAYTGRVYRIHPTIDPMNRTFNVEIQIDNREGLLRPGMFCRVTFDLDKEEAILLPSMAILKMQGSNERYLFVERSGIAERIGVTIGKRYDDDVEVFSDELKTGDRVIVSGQSRLVDGVAVEVVQ